MIASTTIPTTRIQNHAGRSENMEYSGDTLSHHDSLRSGIIDSIESSENA